MPTNQELLARSLARTTSFDLTPPQTKFEKWKGSLKDEDVLFYGVTGVTTVGMLGLVAYGMTRPEPPVVLETPPHDLWSFLGSKQGGALITSSFKLITAIVSR